MLSVYDFGFEIVTLWTGYYILEVKISIDCKKSIKIEKPLHCLSTFSYSVGERNILQTVSLFFSFYFLSDLQSDNNSNRVYVLEHKYILALLRAHFNPRLTARAKMSLSGAQNILMPAIINPIVLLKNIILSGESLL